jgi:hypothetical protein
MTTFRSWGETVGLVRRLEARFQADGLASGPSASTRRRPPVRVTQSVLSLFRQNATAAGARRRSRGLWRGLRFDVSLVEEGRTSIRRPPASTTFRRFTARGSDRFRLAAGRSARARRTERGCGGVGRSRLQQWQGWIRLCSYGATAPDVGRVFGLLRIANQERPRCTRLATWGIFGQKEETDVDALTEKNLKNLKALAGRSVAHVDVRSPDVVELAVPESEGWRLVVSATTDKEGRPALGARWEPGLRHRRDPSVLRRIIHRPRRVTRHRSSCPPLG